MRLPRAQQRATDNESCSLTEGFLAVENARIALRLAVADLTAANMMLKWCKRLGYPKCNRPERNNREMLAANP